MHYRTLEYYIDEGSDLITLLQVKHKNPNDFRHVYVLQVCTHACEDALHQVCTFFTVYDRT